MYEFNDENEKLFRAVYPKDSRPKLWSADGKRITNAVFELREKEKGVSFQRALGRSDAEAIEHLLRKLIGVPISITVGVGLDLKLTFAYDSSKDLYHMELRYPDNMSEIDIKRIQIALAKKAVIYRT